MQCIHCGSTVEGGEKFCKNCGAPLQSAGNTYERMQGEEFKPNMNDKATQNKNRSKSVYDSHTITIAVVSYLTWIGFIVALVSNEKDTPLVKFHLNQALIINIIAFLGPFIPLVGWAATVISVIFMIMGIIDASKGEMNELPVIGSIKIFN